MAALAHPAPLSSPLKRLNASGSRPKPKLASEWDNLSTTPDYLRKHAIDPLKYYREFYCLAPNDSVQREAIGKLTREDLLGPFSSTISTLFATAIVLLSESSEDTVVVNNVLQTLIVLLSDVLERDYEDPADDIVSVLFGDAETADETLTDLVASIDSILQDPTRPPHIRHQAVRLITLLVASFGPLPLAAYFLRRDLFPPLVSFVTNEQTLRHQAVQATLLVGLLAGYKQEGAKNPYAVRIEDFVEEASMIKMIELVTTVLVGSREAYLSVQDDSPPSLISSLTSLVWNVNKLLYIGNPFAWNLPSLPLALAVTVVEPPIELKGKARHAEDQTKDDRVWTATATPDVSTPGSVNTFTSETSIPPLSRSAHASCRSPTRRPLLNKQGNRFSSSSNSQSSDPFYELPPDSLAILVTLYEFWRSNKTFSSLVFSTTASDQTPDLPLTLISVSSYAFSHASTSLRAQVYSRLCLHLLMLLVEDGEGRLSSPVAQDSVRLCRQRRPVLPHQNETGQRPLVASLIDSVVLFLRFNLSRRLDVDSYSIALRLLQRTMQYLKSEKLRLEYDWVVVWRLILTLSSHVVTRIRDLRASNDHVDELISQIFVTMSYAAYWGEQFLPSSFAHAQLHYELGESDAVLSSLSDLLGISSLASPVTSFKVPLRNGGGGDDDDDDSSLPRLRGVDPLSPLVVLDPTFDSPTVNDIRHDLSDSPTFSDRCQSVRGQGRGRGAGFVATESIANLRTSVDYFRAVVADHALALAAVDADEPGGAGGPLEPHEVLAIIEKHLGGVECVESAAMGDLDRFDGSIGTEGRDEWEEELWRVARDDAKRLMADDED
ncbi:hypothetical protein JCM11491_002185 [Sporobolomyces phaffii]